MKLSELIKELQWCEEYHGDLPVHIIHGSNNIYCNGEYHRSHVTHDVDRVHIEDTSPDLAYTYEVFIDLADALDSWDGNFHKNS